MRIYILYIIYVYIDIYINARGEWRSRNQMEATTYV
jgi:hypothetical protein